MPYRPHLDIDVLHVSREPATAVRTLLAQILEETLLDTMPAASGAALVHQARTAPWPRRAVTPILVEWRLNAARTARERKRIDWPARHAGHLPRSAIMSDPQAQWHVIEYEGFEIHVQVFPKDHRDDPSQPPGPDARYAFVGYVCHHGADPHAPGNAVQFHAGGDDAFRSVADALDEARQIGSSIVDGTHPDLSVLSIVTHSHPE